MSYNRVTDEDIAFFRGVCPGDGCVWGEGINADYARDEMPIYGAFTPEALLFPMSAEAVSAIMARCSARGIPVTPRGSGTGLCGGAVPVHGGVALCTSRMNRILEVDEENMTATVEPGVLLMDFAAHVLERGLFYPPEPGEKTATLGGNAMTNAGGMKAVKYGVTRDYVLGMEVVLPDGALLNLGGKVAKNSSGYSLLNLMIGSEGTLGIATRLILRLIPKPAVTVSLLVPFPSLEGCIAAVPALLRMRLKPTAVEFMQREVILAAERYLGRAFPDSSADAYLLLSFDGQNRAEVEAACDDAAQVCVDLGALDAYYADTEERQASLWEARGAFLEGIKASTDELDECDVVVPRSRIADFVTYTHGLERAHGVRIRSFGHAGDGNIHVYVCRDGLPERKWREGLDGVMDALYRKAIEMEGKVSGEHGIGHAKISYLRDSEGDAAVEMMRRVKRAFDPGNILNPGKVTALG